MRKQRPAAGTLSAGISRSNLIKSVSGRSHLQIESVFFRNCLIFSLCFFATLSVNPVYAKESCGEAHVQSGNGTCSELSVQINVSECEGGRPLRAADLECRGSAATARVKTSEADYTVTLKQKKDSWGAIQWEAGRVSREPRKTANRMNKPIPENPIEVRSAELGAPPAAAAAAVVAPTSPSETGFQFAVNFDAYYSWDFNNPRPIPPRANVPDVGAATLPAGNIGTRYYDIYHNQFSLNLAELSISRTGKEVGFLLDLDFGQFADQNVYVSSNNGLIIDEVSKHIGQAYVTYSPKNIKGLTFDFGKLPTHVGLEMMKAKDNWQYSRATTFGFGGPFWHTGLHVGYATSPFATVNFYLYNGWNSIYDNNDAKTFGTQLRFAPSDNLVIVYNLIAGAEQPGNSQNYKMVNEANVTYTPNTKLAIAADFLTGSEQGVLSDGGTAFWHSATLATRHQITPTYVLSPRIEYYQDSNGYTLGTLGTTQTLETFTLTNSFTLAPGYELRIEGRYDHSTNDQQYLTHDGKAGHQATLLSAFLVSL